MVVALIATSHRDIFRRYTCVVPAGVLSTLPTETRTNLCSVGLQDRPHIGSIRVEEKTNVGIYRLDLHFLRRNKEDKKKDRIVVEGYRIRSKLYRDM